MFMLNKRRSQSWPFLGAAGCKFISSAGAATSIIFVATNTCLSWQTCVCHDKHVFVMTKYIFCCNKSLFASKVCWTKLLSRQIFVATNVILSWQNFCCDKLTFVMTNTWLSWQSTKHMFIMTNICCDKISVVASILLSWQKTCFVVKNTSLTRQTYVCQDRTFIMTKLVLVAAAANDKFKCL